MYIIIDQVKILGSQVEGSNMERTEIMIKVKNQVKVKVV